MNLSNLPHSIQHYKIIKQLANGTFGHVYKIQNTLKPSLNIVMKVIKIKSLNTESKRVAQQEVTILKSLNHPNIIKFYDSIIDQQNLYIIMQEGEKGDLYHYLKSRREKGKTFSEIEIWKMIKQLFSAVDYLHSKNIIHRDIKSMNIFITKSGNLKLGDLGVSRFLGNQCLLETRVGTPLYLAPQLVRNQKYSFKIDIWALGCIFYLLTTLELPFQAKNLIVLAQNIVKNNPKPISEKYSIELRSLILQMLQKNAARRPSCEVLLKKYRSLECSNRNINNYPDIKETNIKNLQNQQIRIVLNKDKDKTESTKQQEIKIRNHNERYLSKQSIKQNKNNQISKQMINEKKIQINLDLDLTPKIQNNAVGIQSVNHIQFMKRPISAMIYSQRKYNQLMGEKNALQSSSITLKDLLRIKNINNKNQKSQIQTSKILLNVNTKQIKILDKDELTETNKMIINQKGFIKKFNRDSKRYSQSYKRKSEKADSFSVEVKPKILCLQFTNNNNIS